MKSKNAQLYENVIIRNNQEIGINNYGLDYLVELEQKIDKALKMVSNEKYLHIERLEKIKDILGDKENE